jgi:hypothetical protein
MTQDEKDLDYLRHIEAFQRFMAQAYASREAAIGELQEASTDKVQQIAGRIQAYDEMLRSGDWESVRNLIKK